MWENEDSIDEEETTNVNKKSNDSFLSKFWNYKNDESTIKKETIKKKKKRFINSNSTLPGTLTVVRGAKYSLPIVKGENLTKSLK